MLLGVCIAGVVLGLVGFVISLTRRKGNGEGSSGGSAWLAVAISVVITVAFWAWAMKTRAPYSSGQTLAYGFLIGGLLGAFSAYIRAAFAGSAGTARLTAMSFLALLGAALTLLLFRNYPENALIGFAIGSVMSTVVALLMSGERLQVSVHGTAFALVSVVLSAGTNLAVYRFDTILKRQWWSLPILVGMVAILASVIAVELRTGFFTKLKPATARWVSALISAILVLGVTAIIAWRAVEDMHLFYSAVVGVIVFGIAAWLVERDDNRTGLEKSSLASLLIVAFYVMEFKLWSGLGIGIGLIAAWSALGPLLARDIAESETSQEAALRSAGLAALLGFGAALLLLRLYIQQYRYDIGTRDLEMHFTLVGAMAGAILPAALAACALRNSGGESKLPKAMVIIGGLLAGLALALSPFVVFILWETRALMGLSFGLALGVGMLLAVTRLLDEFDAKRLLLSGLFAVGALLLACQFGDFFLEMETTKAMKLWSLAIAAGASVIWVVIAGIVAARRAQ